MPRKPARLKVLRFTPAENPYAPFQTLRREAPETFKHVYDVAESFVNANRKRIVNGGDAATDRPSA